MTNKLIRLLQTLKAAPSPELESEALGCLENEVYPEELLEQHDAFREAINGQADSFYSTLSESFVGDLNGHPDLYFFVWEPLLYFFDEATRPRFFDLALQKAEDGDAADYINGLLELDAQRPEIALLHFNRIDDYVAGYFIAICYLELGNFENSIRNNEHFLDAFTDTISSARAGDKSLEGNDDYALTRYGVHNDLAYSYNRVQDYANAFRHYEEVLKIYSPEALYGLRHNPSDEQDLFALDLNNMLLAAEKTGNYAWGLGLLEFAIGRYPHRSLYRQQKDLFTKRSSGKAFAEEIIGRVFKTKRPFGIDTFEAGRVLSREKSLEDLIVEQIRYGYQVFGKDLEVYQDAGIYGRQYYLPAVNGILDLLLVEKSTGILYVVELKRNEAGVEVADQIRRYLEGLQERFEGRTIRGIICVHRPDEALVRRTKELPDIELYTYAFDFRKLS
ncbi:MAG: DUF91 domain-containing protein [Chitinophagaceae bacterium]|nr:MAG: DUF91 domain-containing protein [Chitinophagaceae bacterium]